MTNKKRMLTAGLLLLSLQPYSLLAQNWSLTGNSGTVSGTNFLGTTDAVDLRIRTSNTDRIYVSSGGFVGFGTTTPIGSANFVLSSSVGGWSGMYANGTASTTKSFYGYAVQGTVNAYHYYDPATSAWLLRVGAGDRMAVTSTGNVGIGTASPTFKLDVAGTGRFTGAVSVNGILTLGGTLYGGAAYLSSLSSSGTISGSDLITNDWTLDNAGLAGTGSFTFTPDLVVTGSADFTDTWFHAKQIEGRTTNSAAGVTGFALNQGALISFGVIGTANGSASSYGLVCSGNGYYTGTWSSLSDRKFKTTPEPLSNALDLVMQLKPQVYEYKRDEFPQMNFPEGKQYGFIAQEMEKVTPVLVRSSSCPADLAKPEGEKIDFKMVNYIGLIPVLTEAIREQQGLIRHLDSLVSIQQERIAALEAAHGSLPASSPAREKGRLFQNQPNPASGETMIRYSINVPAARASIQLRDLGGKAVKSFPVEVKSDGALIIRTQDLSSGIYSYELIVDGVVADTQKMVIAN